MANENRNTGRVGSDPAEGTRHPVGKGVGALAGAAAGGVAGSVVGPIGTVAGAAIGGIAGWLEGRTIAEGLNPDREMKYWKESYSKRPYYNKGYGWEDYEPAYTHGVYSYDPEVGYDETDSSIDDDWNSIKGRSRLSASEARFASKDAWDRLSDDL